MGAIKWGGDTVKVRAARAVRKEDGPLVEAADLVEPDDVEQEDRNKRDARRDERIHTGVVHQFVLGAPSRKDLACGEGEGAVVSTCMLGAPSREAARL